MLDQMLDFARPVLAVAVYLNGKIVTMQGRIAETGLHRPTDAQIERKADNRRMGGHLPKGVIGGPIINDEHIKMRERALQAMCQLAH